MRVACVQLDSVWESKTASCARAQALLERAQLPAGSLALLPEMFATGFSMDVGGVAEGSERAAETFLRDQARSRGIWLLGGVVTQRDDGRGLNQALAVDAEGREAARYDKIFPFSFGGETRHYASGARVVTFAWDRCIVAPFVCYDLRFPEVFRVAATRGAHLMTVIANWPRAREAHWLALLKARAIENQAYVAGVNRCGSDPHLRYSGRSLIVDPRGEILADGGSDEGVIAADLDLDDLDQYRREFPALADMRSELLPPGA